MQLFLFGIFYDVDAHLFGEIRALGQHFCLKVFSELEFHRWSLFRFSSSALSIPFLGLCLREEFAGDAAEAGPEAAGESVFFQEADFAELADFLADGVGAFGVVCVVDGEVTRGRPAVGSGVEGRGEESDPGMGCLCEQGIGGHLFVFAGFGGEAAVDFFEEFEGGGGGLAEEEAGVDVGHAGAFLLEEEGFAGAGEEVAEGVWGDCAEEDIDITPEEGFAGVVLQALEDEGDFLADALEEFGGEEVAGAGDLVEGMGADGEAGRDGGQEPVAVEDFVGGGVAAVEEHVVENAEMLKSRNLKDEG